MDLRGVFLQYQTCHGRSIEVVSTMKDRFPPPPRSCRCSSATPATPATHAKLEATPGRATTSHQALAAQLIHASSTCRSGNQGYSSHKSQSTLATPASTVSLLL